MPFGDASEWQESRMLTLDQWREVLRQIDEVSEDYQIRIFVEDGLPLCAFEQKYWRFLRPCSCGRTSFTVDTGGGVRPCACNDGWVREEFNFGSDHGPLARLEAERRGLVDRSVCGGCQIRDRCWGGCPNSTRNRREAFMGALNPVVDRVRDG
jgi:radical SAM protein with 4Fe4S-binding SPASM domain